MADIVVWFRELDDPTRRSATPGEPNREPRLPSTQRHTAWKSSFHFPGFSIAQMGGSALVMSFKVLSVVFEADPVSAPGDDRQLPRAELTSGLKTSHERHNGCLA
jgi:hypothetical protein